MRHVLITGPPGIGKTTAISAVAQALARSGHRVRGFVTDEVRGSNGDRIGFRIRTLGDPATVATLASVAAPIASVGSSGSGPLVGRYHVDVASFEAVALPLLLAAETEPREGSNAAVVIIDEIGKMELFSRPFVAAVQRLLSPSNTTCLVVATVSLKGGGLIDDVKKMANVDIMHMARETRDTIPGHVLSFVAMRIKQVT